MGVEKTCKVCKEQFTTTSFKSATTINMCDTRLSKLEKAIEMIPMLIGAEISNVLSELTKVDVIRSIKKELFDALDKEQDKKKRALKRFEDKLQQQIVTLNNKIINIIKEMD